MLKNVIQVDGRYFVITNDNGQPVVKEADTQEIIDKEFENLVIFQDEDDEGVELSMFQKIIDSARRNMEEQLMRDMKSLVMSTLGLIHHNGEFKVYGFNDKESPVAKAIAEKIKDQVNLMDFTKEFDLGPKEKVKFKAAMRDSYKERFEQHVRHLIYEAAKRDAEEAVREYKQQILGDKMKTVAKQLVDAAVEKTKNRWER